MKKILKITVGTALGLIILFVSFVYFSTYHPADIQNEEVFCDPEAPSLDSGQRIKLLSWNIQFMAGNKNNHFFFDGGNDPWPAQKTIQHTLKEVAHILISENADIILLQEVDDGAARTYHRDQLQDLLVLLPQSYRCYTSAFYWKACFIPHPAIMGSAGMKLSVISKYKISKAIRYALSAITSDNIILRQFNPKRAMLEARLPIEGGGDLYAVNTHLSAFAQGSNTMQKQVSQVDELLTKIGQRGSYGFIGGDFNLIPPGNAYARLSAYNKRYFNAQGSEIRILFEKYHTVPSLAEVNGLDYAHWYTNMATIAEPKLPDKTIDYFIFSSGFSADSQYVRYQDTLPISDHLPLIALITIP
jgi:endonuclease/exonuclease/phosphatase family metal-dependent hydrolase